MGWRMKIFLMVINVSACTLKNSSHIFSSVSRKLPPGKFPPIKLPPGEFPPGKFPPRKFPPGIFPPMFLNIPTRVFYFFFSLSLSLILLKRLFCNLCFKSAEVFTFVKICQNKVLSEERQLMRWVGIIQVRISWVATFRGEFSRGEFDGWKFFGWEFPRGEYS